MVKCLNRYEGDPIYIGEDGKYYFYIREVGEYIGPYESIDGAISGHRTYVLGSY